MLCVVLGGSGFIGAHVVDALIAAGHDVRVVSRQPKALPALVPGVDHRFLDYRDRGALTQAIAGSDAVFHLFSATTPGSGDMNPLLDVNDNLVVTLEILDLMLDLGVRRLIYVSSGGLVYGSPEAVPIAESHPLRPISSYGIIKVAIEAYVELFARNKGLLPVILRPSNTYGVRQGRDGAQGLVNTLLRQALLGEPISIWGDGSIVRDHLHAEDLTRLAVMACESGITGVFNAGTGVGTSVRDLIDLVSEITGRRLDVQYGPQRSVDVPVSILDITRAREVLGWRPEISLRDGLTRTWAWHQSNLQKK